MTSPTRKRGKVECRLGTIRDAFVNHFASGERVGESRSGLCPCGSHP